MKNTMIALFVVVSVVLAGYGVVSFQADAQPAPFGQKCGLDKEGAIGKDDILDKQDSLDKAGEFSKTNEFGVGLL